MVTVNLPTLPEFQQLRMVLRGMGGGCSGGRVLRGGGVLRGEGES